jgi:hypothetical protein
MRTADKTLLLFCAFYAGAIALGVGLAAVGQVFTVEGEGFTVNGQFFIIGAPSAAEEADTNLVLHYEFTDTNLLANGNYQDESGWSNHGTQTVANSRATAVSNALDFDGSDDWIDISTNGTAASLNQASTMSVAVWFFAQASGDSAIMAKWAANPTEGQYLLGSDNVAGGAARELFFRLRQTNGTAITIDSSSAGLYMGSGYSLFTNWVHAAAVADGSNLRLYVNGSLITNTAYDGSILTTTNLALIAKLREVDNTWPWNGMVDDPRIYADALTSNEVYTLYTDGRSDP